MKRGLIFILLVVSFLMSYSQVDTVLETYSTNLVYPRGPQPSPISPNQIIDTTVVCTVKYGVVVNGLRVGDWSFDGENGVFCYTKAVVAFDQGELNGEYKSYYPDSRLKSVFTYKNDQEVGPFKCFSQEGHLVFQGVFGDSTGPPEGYQFLSRGEYRKPINIDRNSLISSWVNPIE